MCLYCSSQAREDSNYLCARSGPAALAKMHLLMHLRAKIDQALPHGIVYETKHAKHVFTYVYKMCTFANMSYVTSVFPVGSEHSLC